MEAHRCDIASRPSQRWHEVMPPPWLDPVGPLRPATTASANSSTVRPSVSIRRPTTAFQPTEARRSMPSRTFAAVQTLPRRPYGGLFDS